MMKQAKTLAALLYRSGPLVMVGFVADKLLQRLTSARLLVVSLRGPDVLEGLHAELPPGFTAEVRKAAEMQQLARDFPDVLGADSLMSAERNGDECVVILDGHRVVSFQWVSSGLTWAFDDIWIGFGPRYLYGYNSYTAPSHRGRRLNHNGVVIAARTLALPRGKGLAGYVQASNVASLLAHSRAARLYTGIVLVWPYGKGRLRYFASRPCRAAGLRLVRKPAEALRDRGQGFRSG